jgi:DNA-binding transcriptional MerR regulator
MKMQKKQFRIGELAAKLAVERFVIRFWEKEFGIHSNRSQGGQRFYDEKDAKKFFRIKELLYEKGFTIAGAKKQLALEKDKQYAASVVLSDKTEFEPAQMSKSSIDATAQSLEEQIITLQKQLMKLRELL